MAADLAFEEKLFYELVYQMRRADRLQQRCNKLEQKLNARIRYNKVKNMTQLRPTRKEN